MVQRTCGVLTEKGVPCTRPVTGRRKYCDKHPGGRSKYKPPARATSHASDPRVSPRSTGKPKARTRSSSLIAKRATKLAPLATAEWSDGVRDQLGQVAPEISKGLTVRDCQDLAEIADRLLRGEPIPPAGLIERFLLGPTLPTLLARSLLTTLDLPADQSPIAAARALQSSGIAICRQAGLPLTDCPCFQGPAGSEFEEVLFFLFRLALGHWTGLIIPFHPLLN